MGHCSWIISCLAAASLCAAFAETNSSGYQLAAAFNARSPTRVKYKRVAHRTDAVISKKLGMIFVDNVKTGSQTLRGRIKLVAGVDWQTWEILKRTSCGGCCGRTATTCVNESEAHSYFRWAFVRDPVAKFESGVREIWLRGGSNAKLSADELLGKQLMQPVGSWIDEHLQSNTWRLTGRMHGTRARALPLSFVGKIEHLATDWPAVVDRIVRRSNRPQLRAALLQPLPHTNKHSSKTNAQTGKSSTLSVEAIRRMCASGHFQGEWGAFDYPKPVACRANKR